MANFSRKKSVSKFLSFFFIFFVVFNFSTISRASVEWSGNIKTFGINKDLPAYSRSQNSLQASNKNAALYTYNDQIKFEAAYELTVLYEKPLTHQNTISAYRFDDFKPYLHDEKINTEHKTLLMHNLNRFNLNLNTTLGDFVIGRAPIAFGSSKSLNPTDVLTPFALNTIDKEERIGVDAVVYKKSLGEISFLEVGSVLGKNAQSEVSAIYLRPRFNINEYEITLTAMRFKEKNLLGFDLQHPIQDAGFWFETAFVEQDTSKSTRLDPKSDFWRMTSGIDYKFQSSLYLSGEYHYNGSSGKLNPIRLLDFIYLKDEHYFILTTSYEFTALLIGSLQSYYNSHDQSSLNIFKLEYNLSDNAYLSIGSFWSMGDEISSEFGRTGKTHYASMRFYY